MVKPGKVQKCIKRAGDNKSCSLGSLLYEFFRMCKLSHPVPEEGEEIPQDDKPEEVFELKPSWTFYVVMVYPVQQVAHSRDEQDMSDLMRYQTFCPPMPLHSINRYCPANQGESHRKTKGFGYGDFISHGHGGWSSPRVCAAKLV